MIKNKRITQISKVFYQSASPYDRSSSMKAIMVDIIKQSKKK